MPFKGVRIIYTIFPFIMAACTPVMDTAVPTTTNPKIASTSTAGPSTIPTQTASSTAVAIQTEPSPSPTSETVDPLRLSSENAAAIIQLAQLTRGSITKSRWSPDGSRLALATSTGVHLYDAEALQLLAIVKSDLPVDDVYFTAEDERLVLTIAGDIHPFTMLLDTVSGETIATLEGVLLAMSNDGQTAVSWVSSDFTTNQVTLSWQNLQTGAVERTLELEQPPMAYSFAANTFFTAVYNDSENQIRLNDGTTGQTGRTIELLDGSGTLAVSPNGRILATTNSDYAIQIWDAVTGEQLIVLTGFANWIEQMQFSPDGRLLAAINPQDHTRLWNSATGELLYELPGGNQIEFTPDGQILAVTNRHSVQLVDVETGRKLRTLEGYSSPIDSLAIAPDSNLLATTGGNGRQILLWDLSGGELVKSIESEEWAAAVSISPNGRWLAWGGLGPDYSVQLYDLEAEAVVGVLTGHSEGVAKTLFSPDSQILVSSSWNQEGRFWQVDTQNLLVKQKLHFHAAFHPNGRFVALEENDLNGTASVEIRDLKTWEVLHTYPISGHIFGFNPEGHLLAMNRCCDDETAAGVMDIETGHYLSEIEGVCGKVVLSPDGRLLAGCSNTAGSNNLLVWDVATGKRLVSLPGHTLFYETRFSPNGRWLVTAGWDGTIRVWGIQP